MDSDAYLEMKDTNGNTNRIPEVRCSDAEDSFRLERRVAEAREGMETKTGTDKEKAGDFLARLPRPCRREARVWVVLAQFGLPVN